MFEIGAPSPGDFPAIEDLLDRAFGPGRRSKVSYRYRDGAPPIAELALVARQAGRIVGTIAYWPVAIGGTPALLLGPLAVDPDWASQGIGSALMTRSLAIASTLGYGAVLLVGDPAYYRRFAFVPAAARGVVMPHENPERLQLRELRAGGLSGVTGEVRPHAPASRARVA